MPEIWDALALDRQQRATLDQLVNDSKRSCEQAHDKKCICDCSECFPKALDWMRRKYLEQEWLSNRPELLEQLSKLFLEVEQHHVPLAAVERVERLIYEARSEWLRTTIGNSQTTRKLVKSHAAVLQTLEDPHVDLNVLLDKVDDALGSLPTRRDLEAALNLLCDSVTDEDRFKAAQAILFPDPEGRRTAENCDTSREEEGGKFKTTTPPLDLAMAGILDKLATGRVRGEMRNKHLKRLDELRRARAAHEKKNTKTKKSRDRQAENRTSKSQAPGVLHALGTCSKCSIVPDPDAFISCALCQVLKGLGQEQPAVVFCSSACARDELEKHFHDTHTCASGSHCVSYEGGDRVIKADGEGSDIVLCSECFSSFGIGTPYCSAACADRDLQNHREAVHIPQRERQNGAGKLAHGIDDATQHRPADITGAVTTTLSQALAELEQPENATLKLMSWKTLGQ